MPKIEEIDSIQNTPENSEESGSNEFDQWETIGYHRALGGFFFNLVIMLFSAIIGILFLAFLTNLLYPWPEIQGYSKVAGGFFFALVYQIFDFGTAYGIQRFIAEYRVKDPNKMIKYIQFFVWYQMMTGIIQVTIISVVVIYVVNNTEFAYLAWIFLIMCQKQWPGMLGTFKAVLEGMQLYNKTNILQFIGSDIIQNITNVIFILLGRYFGAQNPAIGEMLGATIGTVIGTYVDDFFAMALSMKFLGKVIEPFGLQTRDLWACGFDWPIAKQCMWFGLQMSIVPIINSATSTYMMFMYLTGLPQFTTFVALRDIAAGIVGIVNVGSYGSTPLIAESYMNNKKKLASFYITTSIRWNGFLMWMLVAVLIAFIPMILEVLLALPELANYTQAQVFLIPCLIAVLFRPFVDFPNGILIGTERVSFYTFVRVFEEVLQVFFIWLFLFHLKLQTVYGINGIVFILSFEHFFPRFIKMIMCWVYIKKTLFSLKINWWQTLIGPLIASAAVFGVGQLWFYLVFTPMVPAIGIIPSAAVTLVFGLIAIPFLIYLPLSGLMGMWDDFSIDTFRKAVEISGPSKFLVKLFYKSTLWGINHSKIHNKFKIEWEVAAKEIAELIEMKQNNEIKTYQKPISATAPWMKKQNDGNN
jgi:hypothetical protein